MTRRKILPLFLVASFFLISHSFTAKSSSTDPKKRTAAALTRSNFEDSVLVLYKSAKLDKAGLNYDVFRYGMIGYHSLRSNGKLGHKNIVSFIDFTKPSTERRFYTVDLDRSVLLYHSLVSHGRNTGENIATNFSNRPHSNQSSIGFYVTGETYVGSKGYSMRLDGVDGSYNDRMRERAVVMHDADYVSDYWIKKYGRLGRSQGCPALPKAISRKVIDSIKDRTVVFAYFNDAAYLKSSTHLNIENLFTKLDALAQLN